MSASSRDPATKNQSRTSKGGPAEALELMQRALQIIDTIPGAEDVGAHLDLALNRLRERIDRTPPK